MKKGTKIWLCLALLLSICVSILNATEGRWASVAIAIIALAGLCLLLFKQRKTGFYIMCACNTLSFLIGVYGGIQGGTGILLSVLMSFIGSALIPAVTFCFLRSHWKQLR